jgi:ketosteroid isomerase-like protein
MCRVTPNVDLVREGLAAFLGGDMDRAMELAHPEIVSTRTAPLPDPQTYHGFDGLTQMYADWTADFDEFEMESVEFTEVGQRVIVEMINRGTGKASGVVVAGTFWFVYTIAEGRIVRLDAYLTEDQALEAASRSL